MQEETAAQIRRMLETFGFYPTPAGVAVMENLEEQAAARAMLNEEAPRLRPGDLMAIATLATCLGLGQC